jgi:hypothetical protein
MKPALPHALHHVSDRQLQEGIVDGNVRRESCAGYRCCARIGRVTALAFAREDARAVVTDTDERGGQETLSTLRAGGGEGLFVRGLT